MPDGGFPRENEQLGRFVPDSRVQLNCRAQRVVFRNIHHVDVFRELVELVLRPGVRRAVRIEDEEQDWLLLGFLEHSRQLVSAVNFDVHTPTSP